MSSIHVSLDCFRILNRNGHSCTATMSDESRCTRQGSDVDHITPGNHHSDTTCAPSARGITSAGQTEKAAPHAKLLAGM